MRRRFDEPFRTTPINKPSGVYTGTTGETTRSSKKRGHDIRETGLKQRRPDKTQGADSLTAEGRREDEFSALRLEEKGVSSSMRPSASGGDRSWWPTFIVVEGRASGDGYAVMNRSCLESSTRREMLECRWAAKYLGSVSSSSSLTV